MFREFCGDATLKNVILVTNMWGEVTQDVGEARERELTTNFSSPSSITVHSSPVTTPPNMRTTSFDPSWRTNPWSPRSNVSSSTKKRSSCREKSDDTANQPAETSVGQSSSWGRCIMWWIVVSELHYSLFSPCNLAYRLGPHFFLEADQRIYFVLLSGARTGLMQIPGSVCSVKHDTAGGVSPRPPISAELRW